MKVARLVPGRLWTAIATWVCRKPARRARLAASRFRLRPPDRDHPALHAAVAAGDLWSPAFVVLTGLG